MKHVKGEYARTLKYYYAKRNKEQKERWEMVLKMVQLDKNAGEPDEKTIEHLMQSGFRILLEDTRATENKIKGDYHNE